MKNNTDSSFKLSFYAIIISSIALLLFVFTAYLIIDLYQAKDLLTVELKLISDGKVSARQIEDVVDSISYANQMGRLDIVSVLLAILAMILGFGAIFGFLHIRQASVIEAREEAVKWLGSENGKGELKIALEGWFQANPEELKKIVHSYLQTNIKAMAEKVGVELKTMSEESSKELLEAVKPPAKAEDE